MWRRFSSARTHYTRRRKAHFSELAERRDEARVIKERILAEAEEISGSTDWGPTSRRYRELMAQWKAAGPAPRGVEDSLWKRFRAAQDTFFGARTAHQSQRDDEQQANLTVKEGILAQAEALLPITDWKTARQQLRALQERWEDAGHVPRDAMRSVEGRMRRVEDAIREAEQNEWQRSNPEARARAQDTVTQLEASIADLESKAVKARDAGNERKAARGRGGHRGPAVLARAGAAGARRVHQLNQSATASACGSPRGSAAQTPSPIQAGTTQCRVGAGMPLVSR